MWCVVVLAVWCGGGVSCVLCSGVRVVVCCVVVCV